MGELAEPCRERGPDGPVGFRVYLGWNNPAAAEALARQSPIRTVHRMGTTSRPPNSGSSSRRRRRRSARSSPGSRSQGFTVELHAGEQPLRRGRGHGRPGEAAFGTSFGMYNVAARTLRSPSARRLGPDVARLSVVTGVDRPRRERCVRPRRSRRSTRSAAARRLPQRAAALGLLGANCSRHTRTRPASPTVATRRPRPGRSRATPPPRSRAPMASAAYDGAGQTVAIIDAYASPTILQDVNQWSTNRGLPTMNAGAVHQVVPPGHLTRARRTRAGPAGLVRRGDPRRRGRARHGACRQDRLCRRTEQLPGSGRGDEPRRRPAPGPDRDQLVWLLTTELLPPGYVKPLEDTLSRPPPKASASISRPATTAMRRSTFGFADPDWPASSPWVTAVGGTSLGVTQANTRALETGWGTSN